MTMLKTINGHAHCHFIQNYLEKDGRAIAHDFVNLDGRDEQRNWSYFMDKAREGFGTDIGWGSKRSIQYKHFIISPDPEDHITLEQLRELTCAWTYEMFGHPDGTSGKFGFYHVAIVYHDDNTRGIPHAHVVVNNVNVDTGKRLHLSNKDTKKTLPNRLQALAKERGFNHFGNVEDKTKELEPKLKANRTAAELAMLKEQRFSWKQDLRNSIDIAVRSSKSYDDCMTTISRMGVEVVQGDGDDWKIVHPRNSNRWACYGKTLGADYTPSALRKRVEQIGALTKTIRANVSNNVKRHINHLHGIEDLHLTEEQRREALKTFFENATIAAVVKRGAELGAISRCLRINERYEIRCFEDYRREMSKVVKQIKTLEGLKTNDEQVRTRLAGLKKSYSELAAAKKTADKSELFAGVVDAGAKKSGAAKPSGARGQTKPHATAAKSGGRKRTWQQHIAQQRQQEQKQRKGHRR